MSLIMGIKDLFLNKGWAGKTLSRAETATRLNPLIRAHCALNHSHEYAVRALENREAADELAGLQRMARMDTGKLSEVVLSAGGTPFNGTSMEPEDFNLGKSDREIVQALGKLEGEFEQLLRSEMETAHQMRTRAILSAVLTNTRTRRNYVRKLIAQRR